MTWTFAVDPALRSAGVAAFKLGRLYACERITLPADTDEDLGQRCVDMARRIAKWCDAAMALWGAGEREHRACVIEWPQAYRGAKSLAPPADLFPLSGVACAVSALVGGPLRTPTPAEWSGGSSKTDRKTKRPYKDPWKSPRGMRIAAALMPVERKLVPASHDAIDATGIGLWALGRFEPLRIMPGAV